MNKNLLVVYKKNFELVHDDALESIRSELTILQQSLNFTFDFTPREKVERNDFIERDLVIVIGGDGTLTSICHNIDDNTQVMGVNSHPRHQDSEGSLGFYMDSNTISFAEDIQAALEGQAFENELPRLQATITSTSGNRIQTDPAINDLLIANTHQYAPSKYRVKRGDLNVVQSSSGLLFSTFLGQGAWFANLVDVDKLNFDESQLMSHYLVVARDISPNQKDMHSESQIAWTSKPSIITSDMHRGYAVPDGWDEYHFNRGATIQVDMNAPKLKLLTFRQPIMAKMQHLINRTD